MKRQRTQTIDPEMVRERGSTLLSVKESRELVEIIKMAQTQGIYLYVGDLVKEKDLKTPYIQLNLHKMKKVLDKDVENLTVTVEGGLLFGELQKELEESNLYLPIDAPYYHDRTLAELVLMNVHGLNYIPSLSLRSDEVCHIKIEVKISVPKVIYW